jgi:DNA-binding NtrC family response regulator
MGKQVKGISPEAADLMVKYQWPGNIRELQNVMERAVLIAEGETLLPGHLPENVQKAEYPVDEHLKKGTSIEDYTRAFILKHQQAHSEQEIAEMLGITRKTLWEKRKKWGLKRPSLQTVTEEHE